MLRFSLPSQWLFVADTKRHWAPSQRGQSRMWLFEQPCSTRRALQSRAADDDCRSRGTRCRGREGEVFDFKLCTRLEIYKQKRSKSSPAILLLRSAVFCGFVLIWIYSKDLHAHFCVTSFWWLCCSFQKAIRSVIFPVIKFIVWPEEHLPWPWW